MYMTRRTLSGLLLVAAALLCATDAQAQSLKDLFNKENIEKVVNAVTDKNTASMEGTWTYTGSALAFESDNLLQQAGGAGAASAGEKKWGDFLQRGGIQSGPMSFTLAAGSTLHTTIQGGAL